MPWDWSDYGTDGNNEPVWIDEAWVDAPPSVQSDWEDAPPSVQPDLNDFWKNLTPQKIMDLIGPVGKAIGGAGIASLLNSAMSGGPKVPRAYPGGIPNLVANREQLAQPAQGRRPGSGGVTYFSPMTYSKAAPAPAPAAGMTDAQLDSIGAFLQTNPTPEELAAAMQKFGVSQADVARARARLGTVQTDRRKTATTPAPSPSPAPAPAPLPAGASPFVIGGSPVGSYTPAPSPAPTPAASPADARLQSIAAFLKTNPTQQALAAAMQQHGVSQNDVDLARLQYGNSPGADTGGILGYYANMIRNPQPAPTPAPSPFVIGGTPTQAAAPTSSMTNEQLDSIGAFLNTQPTQEALSSAMQQFGVNQIDVNAARARLGATANPFVIGGTPTKAYAQGGIASLGYAKGRLLNGPGDGVSDSIPATINGTHPAALADGEYVIPARIVSELGNGSTKAGAQKLDAMMKRIQASRRKATDIAANTRVDKHLPA